MSEWYYAKNGQQTGPVTFEALQEFARRGELDPMNVLVWTSTMRDWAPAGTVPGLFAAAVAPRVEPAPADPANPYAAPQTLWQEPAAAVPLGAEIPPGSDPIDAVACIKRGFDLTLRNFGVILLVGAVYFGLLMGVGFLFGMLEAAMGFGQSMPSSGWDNSNGPASTFSVSGSGLLSNLVSQVFSTFLMLGLTRIFLDLVSGQQVEVGMLFGQGRKLLKALAAYILFGLAVTIGFLLLIVPGVYLILRYGHFLTAMVDRDLGIIESFQYSSRITTNNRTNLFVLGLLSLLIVIAGFLALCIGWIFAYPLVFMAWMVAYRWMQYGSRVALTDPVPGAV